MSLNTNEIPWSSSFDEEMYKNAGFKKTKGTCFLTPPSNDDLLSSFKSLNNPNSNLFVGTKALCKHFNRLTRDIKSNDIDWKHPFWNSPTGSEFNKNQIALDHLKNMLQNACWKNIFFLSSKIIVFEIRNKLGFGMRWTIGEPIVFRGFVEPNVKI